MRFSIKAFHPKLVGSPCKSAIFYSATYLVIFREKAKEKAEKPKSASHQIVPEIEHLLENTTNHTDVHDLGSHTVSVTHFDLDKKVKRKKKEKESYDKHYFKTKVVCFLISYKL